MTTDQATARGGPVQQQAEVVVYSLAGCIYCVRARRLLKARGIGFEEISVASLPGARSELADRTGGATVPQIVIDGEPIGGSDALARLDRRGVLEARVQRRPFPIEQRRRALTPAGVARWLGARLRGRAAPPPWRPHIVLVDRNGVRTQSAAAP